MDPALRTYGSGWDSTPPTLWICLDTYQWVQFFLPTQLFFFFFSPVGWCGNVLCSLSYRVLVLIFQKNEDHHLSQFAKPKQKRHRCRNPNKIDINTLTGEERVPVVNIRNGRKASVNVYEWIQSISHKIFFTLAVMFITCITTDGRSHGTSNEGFTPLAGWKSRICYRPRLDGYSEAIGESFY